MLRAQACIPPEAKLPIKVSGSFGCVSNAGLTSLLGFLLLLFYVQCILFSRILLLCKKMWNMRHLEVRVRKRKKGKAWCLNQENLLPSFFFLLTKIIKTSVFLLLAAFHSQSIHNCLGHFHFVIGRIHYINFQDLSQEKWSHTKQSRCN